MVKGTQNNQLDEIDKELLRFLQEDSRLSNIELARRVSLSPPATYARVRRMEEQGLIARSTVIVDREQAGFDLLCFVQIGLQVHQFEKVEHFRQLIGSLPEVLECHHITGEYDYLLKVVLRNRKELERFIVERLTPIPGMARIHTSLVLNEVKSTTILPLT
jgi:DNA-binding Lrp family transcriptional regulator